MAFRLAELFVEITGRMGGLSGTLGAAHAALMQLGPAGSRAGSSLVSGLAGPLLGLTGSAAALGVALGVGLAAAAVVGLGHCAMQAAHLQEAVAKVEQAFGSATPKVLAMADQLAAKFGVINQEILDVAASFGLMLQGAGVGRELSADMSVMLSKMAVDAASYFDVSMTEAIQRMQSGLAGQMESVQRWGVNLTETNVKRQGAAMGFSGKGDLSQEVKTLIRYKLILEGLKAAEGDAERSSGRLVGQWKLFTGELYTLATTIGAVAVPVFTGLLLITNQFLSAINGLTRFLLGMVKSFYGWQASLVGMMGPFGDPDKADQAARQKAIDARIDKSMEDKKKDEKAAKLTAAAEKDREKKGWVGGLEEYAKRIQEGAFGAGKDKVAKDQLKEQQAMSKLLSEIKDKLGKPIPAVAS